MLQGGVSCCTMDGSGEGLVLYSEGYLEVCTVTSNEDKSMLVGGGSVGSNGLCWAEACPQLVASPLHLYWPCVHYWPRILCWYPLLTPEVLYKPAVDINPYTVDSSTPY